MRWLWHAMQVHEREGEASAPQSEPVSPTLSNRTCDTSPLPEQLQAGGLAADAHESVLQGFASELQKKERSLWADAGSKVGAGLHASTCMRGCKLRKAGSCECACRIMCLTHTGVRAIQ